MTSSALRPGYASCECSGEIEGNTGGAVGHQRVDHSGLEAEVDNGRRDRERPPVDAFEDGRVERQGKYPIAGGLCSPISLENC